jgi:glucokinase-like ROK family protein
MIKKTVLDRSLNDNAIALLATIWNLGPTSRTHLARLNDIPASTITRLVRELEKANLVQEVGKEKSTGGREPKLLGLNPDAGQVISIDLSGTKIHGGIVDAAGNLLVRVTQPFQGNGREIIENQMIEMISGLINLPFAQIRPTLGIGVSIPGTINKGFDTIRDSTFLGIKDYPIGKILGKRFNLPVYVEHDTSAAALAEKYFGSGNRQSELIYITVSNGIGAGIIISDQIYRGTNEEAGELGHITIERDGLFCPCGKRGCLETVASRPAIISSAKRMLDQGSQTLLRKYTNPSQPEITLDMIAQAAREEDRISKEILRNAADYLAMAIGSLTSILDIYQIIIGGEVAQLGDAFFIPLRESISKYQFSDRPVSILPAALGSDATLKGVSVLTLQHSLNIL